MKKAFSTVACMASDYQEIVLAAERAHMDAVEIRMGDDGTVCGISRERFPELLAFLKGHGVTICDIGTSVTFQGYEPEKIACARQCAELAASLGVKGFRVFLGNFAKRFSEQAFYSYEGIVESLKELCQAVKGYGVEVWVETHNEFSTGKILKKLCEDVAMDNLKIIWDIIHPIEQGEKPEQTMDLLRDRIAHVHLKDGVKKTDPDWIDYTYTRLGEGELPIKEILSLLRQNGYTGYLSLEWEKQWRAEIKDAYESLDVLLQDYNELLQDLTGEMTDIWK